MSTNTYITFTNSNSSLSKRFRVVAGSLHRVPNKTQNRRRTLNGHIDNQEGKVYKTWTMMLRMSYQETDTNYGTLSDLETFYGYNNPTSTPTNIITFVDHLGTSYTVNLVGTMDIEVLTPVLDGTNSQYVVAISIEETL